MVIIYSQGDSVLADSGTEQLEFIALSQRTGDPKYQQKVLSEKFLHILAVLLYCQQQRLGERGCKTLWGCSISKDIILSSNYKQKMKVEMEYMFCFNCLGVHLVF